MSSIVRRGNSYRVRFRTPDGEQRNRAFRIEAEAKAFRTSIDYKKLTADFADPVLGRQTFGSWWAQWRATRVDLRPSTIARDESYAKTRILPRLGSVQLADIDRTLLRGWVAEMSASGLAPATVVKTIQITSKALAAAADERLIARNPAERLPLPRVEMEPMRFLVPVEIGALADAIDPRYRVWALTAAYSGLRFGELAALRRGRIELLRRKLDVTSTVVEMKGHHHDGPPKTRAGRRSVPIPSFLADELTTHTAGMDADALVFSAPEGGYLRASLFRRRVWRSATIAADVAPLRPHDMRHTAVSLWIATGASVKEIAVWAGHSSVASVLDRYGHLLPGQEDRVTDALDAMYAAARPAPVASVSAIK